MSHAAGPYVSVVIPVFNVERYLVECLDSVLSQTLADIEIICIDDGSTDGSPQILERYASLDDRIRLVSKKNEGQAAARNLAVSMARGEYIVFVDSDDIVELTLCEHVYRVAERNLADVVVYDYVASDHPIEARASGRHCSSLDNTRSDDRHSLLGQMGVVWTKCVRAGFFLEQGLAFPAGRIYEDIVVHWQLITLAKRLIVLPEVLYYYRVQPTATTFRTDWKIVDRLYVYDILREFLTSTGLYSLYSECFLGQQLATLAGLYDGIDRQHRDRVLGLIKERLQAEHWSYVDSGKPLRWLSRDFYLALRGSPWASARRFMWLTMRYVYRKMQIRRIAKKFGSFGSPRVNA